MKLWISLLLCLVLAVPSFSIAGDKMRHVTVTWSYVDAPADLAGFKLYRDGVQCLDIQDPLVRNYEADILVSDSNNIFTMTAYDTAGGESAHSDPYALDPPPGGSVSLITISVE